MAKLYFRYGTMGSSKTANALMTRFNYIERGYHVLLLKPALDSRDAGGIVRSRIGLTAEAVLFQPGSVIRTLLDEYERTLPAHARSAALLWTRRNSPRRSRLTSSAI